MTGAALRNELGGGAVTAYLTPMLDRLKSFVDRIAPVRDGPLNAGGIQPRDIDRDLAAAALMVRVIAADGVVTTDEERRLRTVLRERYDLTRPEADALVADAEAAHEDAIDLYRFTSVLKSGLDEPERLALVEDLWDMVYADGEVHELEDNVVWRVAELLGITSDKRIALKLRVKERALTSDGAGDAE